MAVELATAYVNLVPSAKGIQGSLTRELNGPAEAAGKQAGGRLGAGLKNAALVAVGGFSAVAAAGLVKGSIDAASDLNESVSKVGVVFGDSQSEIQDWAKTSATSIGQSRQQALEAAGTFGNLFTALKIGQGPAADMSKSLVNLAGDLASFNNVSPDEALIALRAGLVGETEPLRRFGVNMNDATLRAEALRLGLISNVKDALDPAVKAQAAYSLILAQTTTAQGDFARTSNGLANKQRILSAQWTDAKAKIGTALLPVMITLTSFLARNLGPTIDGISATFRFFGRNMDIIGPIVGGLATAVLVLLVPSFIAWATAAGAAAVATLAAAAPVILIGIAIAALAAGIIYAYTHFKIFRDVVQTVGKVLAEEVKIGVEIAKIVIGDLVSIVQTVARIIGDLVRGFSALFRGDWRGAWEAFSDIPKAIIEFFVDFVKRRLDAVVSIIGDVPAGIAKAAVGMFDGIKDAFRAAINWIIDAWNGLEFKLPTVDTHIPGIGKVGGFVLGTEPKIPRLHSGGVVPGPVGAEVPIMALAGETVLPIGAGRGGVTIQHLEVRPVTMDATAPDIVNALSAKLGWKVALASRAAT